ncbi:DMT family transporter [Clostridium swellfunianum]|uniref:DMT family transporter n=1 Tax=Clostridium swellfunianum TaxID=1367462 RepID=UPI0020306479|nr:DMT family transporter [Clostridium swellfunianum]MCM0647120.1 DMT family transporter [Clostridium swellfunianum]
MLGVILSIVAGVAMSLQGVFNTRLGDKIGTWETNVIVQATGLILSLIALFIVGNGSFKNIKDANKLYLLGGALGVVIIITVMMGIKSLGPTCAITIILIAQLTAAALIDAFGLFDSVKVAFGTSKIIGVVVMIVGILIFKWKC